RLCLLPHGLCLRDGLGAVHPDRDGNPDHFQIVRALGLLRGGQMNYYLLFYEVVDDYVEKRAQFRAEHLALGEEYVDRGEIVLAGALANPVDGAVLVFRAESPIVVESFVAADPYVKNGLVTSWRIREWTVVVGST